MSIWKYNGDWWPTFFKLPSVFCRSKTNQPGWKLVGNEIKVNECWKSFHFLMYSPFKTLNELGRYVWWQRTLLLHRRATQQAVSLHNFSSWCVLTEVLSVSHLRLNTSLTDSGDLHSRMSPLLICSPHVEPAKSSTAYRCPSIIAFLNKCWGVNQILIYSSDENCIHAKINKVTPICQNFHFWVSISSMSHISHDPQDNIY